MERLSIDSIVGQITISTKYLQNISFPFDCFTTGIRIRCIRLHTYTECIVQRKIHRYMFAKTFLENSKKLLLNNNTCVYVVIQYVLDPKELNDESRIVYIMNF